MDNKRLILSVAGSGKTTYIIKSLSLKKRAIIITYTKNNYENLRLKIAEKFGKIPNNIIVLSYFEFLYSFCYRPFLHHLVKANGIDFNNPPSYTYMLKRTDKDYYINSNNCLYHNRIAKLIQIQKVVPKIKDRLEKYFDEFYIDEIQDFGGHDFNLLIKLSKISNKIIFVGDFYQHTFDTSRDGNVNCNLYKDYNKYIDRFRKVGFYIDKKTLSKSWRCNKSICNFIENKIGILIKSHRKNMTNIKLIEEKNYIDRLMNDNSLVKLFYQNSRKYDCYSTNWGASKGQDCYKDVCVVLNKKTYKQYKNENLREMNTQTRNKFYVACTRARNKLVFLPEKLIKRYKFKR